MSSDIPIDVVRLIEDTKDITIEGYLQTAALTFLLYDYLLTLPTEIKHVWQCKFRRLFNMSFFAARYFGMVAFFIQVIVGQNVPSCTAWMRVASSSFVVSQAGMIAILIMRFYALIPPYRYIMIPVVILGAASLMPEIWSTAAYECLLLPFHRSQYLKNIAAHVISLVFETVLFCRIVSNTWRIVRQVRHGVSQHSLPAFLLEDALFSYILLVLSNLVFTIMYFRSDPLLITVEAQLSQPLTVLLTCRALIGLRELNRTSEGAGRERTLETVSWPTLIQTSEPSEQSQEESVEEDLTTSINRHSFETAFSPDTPPTSDSPEKMQEQSFVGGQEDSQSIMSDRSTLSRVLTMWEEWWIQQHDTPDFIGSEHQTADSMAHV